MLLKNLSYPDQKLVIPKPRGGLVYHCLGCGQNHGIDELLYTCPNCGEVLLIEDQQMDLLRRTPGALWRRVFDMRRMINLPALKGILRYHELIAPVIPLDCAVYLGEGHTPMVEACPRLKDAVGMDFCFKNDGQNPSASFKDRGMAVALSYINYLIKHRGLEQVLAVAASTGDTSASAALYASYLAPAVASAVILPRGKVTPQQLSQPLGSGAAVFEIPGVFDDCMKVVEFLAEHYQVALLNSKNAWRIRGQESYPMEVAQDLDYDMSGQVLVVPIGNAGNITAMMAGLLKMLDLGIITELPILIGVQSHHADPVFRYYSEPDPDRRVWNPVDVQPSVAQAAMIGNPVSMPRVIALARRYEEAAGKARFFVVQVSEQQIMDSMVLANLHGHIACTQGGESLAGLIRAKELGIVGPDQHGILDATAHQLKFAGFQQMYFENTFPPEFGVVPRPELANFPRLIAIDGVRHPAPGRPLTGQALGDFIAATGLGIAIELKLQKKSGH